MRYVPPRGYSSVTLRVSTLEELEHVRERLGTKSLSEALEELARRVEEFAPELLECKSLEKHEDGAYLCSNPR